MSSSSKEQFIDDDLTRRKQGHRFRTLTPYTPQSATVISDGERELVNFSGNDYLGLSQHPEVIDKAREYVSQ